MEWIKKLGKSIKDLFRTLANPAEDGQSVAEQAELDAFMRAKGAGDYKDTLRTVVEGLQNSRPGSTIIPNGRVGSQTTEVRSKVQRRDDDGLGRE